VEIKQNVQYVLQNRQLSNLFSLETEKGVMMPLRLLLGITLLVVIANGFVLPRGLVQTVVDSAERAKRSNVDFSLESLLTGHLAHPQLAKLSSSFPSQYKQIVSTLLEEKELQPYLKKAQNALQVPPFYEMQINHSNRNQKEQKLRIAIITS
jgi:hypothetical protein